MKAPVQSPPPPASPADALVDRVLVTAFLENIPDAVYFKDRDGRFIAVSQSKVLRNGLTHHREIVGKTDFDFVSPKHAQRAREDEEQVMRTGQPIIGKLERMIWADGHETWSIINKLPLRDADGTIIGTFGITRDVTESKRMEQELDKARRDLLDASRMAGMAEIASSVLHNVGNVLNSLNITASVITTGLRESRIDTLRRICALLHEHRADLGTYVTEDPKGRRLPELLDSFAAYLAAELQRLLHEAESLQQNVDHIKEIVAMQQAYATMAGMIEPLDAAELMEHALRMNGDALVRHGVRVVRDYRPVPSILAERAKVLQILVNLVQNAKHAASTATRDDKVLTVQIAPLGADRVQLVVADNGVGITPENLTRIFGHGFTTRKDGHGFGLHFSATSAGSMKGSLTAHSDGPGRGAAFTLELPAALTPS